MLLSKLDSNANQCGHVDKLTTGGPPLRKTLKRFYLVYIDILTKYPLIYIGRSRLGDPTWTGCPRFCPHSPLVNTIPANWCGA